MALDRAYLFDTVRHSLFGGKLTPGQVNGITAILDEWEAGDNCDDRQLAYILATAYHETAKTMMPIAEIGKGRGRNYGQRIKMSGKRYYDTPGIFYGRGYSQLTWYENYEKFGRLLDIDLLHNPDLALQPDIAVKILFLGMQKGLFTGKKLSDYFNGGTEDWVKARRIVNGNDRADVIASYGRRFFAAVKHS